MTNLPSFTHSSPLSCKCPAIAFRIFSNVFPEALAFDKSCNSYGSFDKSNNCSSPVRKTRYTLFPIRQSTPIIIRPISGGMFYINIFTPGSFPFSNKGSKDRPSISSGIRQPFNARKVGSKSRNSTGASIFSPGFRLLFMFSGNFIIKGIAAEPS